MFGEREMLNASRRRLEWTSVGNFDVGHVDISVDHTLYQRGVGSFGGLNVFATGCNLVLTKHEPRLQYCMNSS